MLVVSIWGLEIELIGANLLIVLSYYVIAEYSGFRGANSLPNLLMEVESLRLLLEVDFALQNQCNSLHLIRSISRRD